MEVLQIIVGVVIASGVGYILFGENLPGVIVGFVIFMVKLIVGLVIVGIIGYVVLPFILPYLGLGGLI